MAVELANRKRLAFVSQQGFEQKDREPLWSHNLFGCPNIHTTNVCLSMRPIGRWSASAVAWHGSRSTCKPCSPNPAGDLRHAPITAAAVHALRQGPPARRNSASAASSMLTGASGGIEFAMRLTS